MAIGGIGSNAQVLRQQYMQTIQGDLMDNGTIDGSIFGGAPVQQQFAQPIGFGGIPQQFAQPVQFIPQQQFGRALGKNLSG